MVVATGPMPDGAVRRAPTPIPPTHLAEHDPASAIAQDRTPAHRQLSLPTSTIRTSALEDSERVALRACLLDLQVKIRY